MSAGPRSRGGGSGAGSPTPSPDPCPPGRFRYWLTAVGLWFLVRVWVRLRVVGLEHVPSGPAVVCFTHQSWADPFVVVAALPARPDLVFLGPREADMRVGTRNRLVRWSGRDVPFRPDGRALRTVTRRVDEILRRGDRLVIAPEGRIHAGERVVLPLDPGAAYFALRAGVPVVPVGITGMSWIRFGGTVRVRVGHAIETAGRPTGAGVLALTEEIREALLGLVADGRDREPPGRFGSWLTEIFQDWPEGRRPPTRVS